MRVSDYWRGVAGNYNWQLRSNGIMPDPVNPIPPKLHVQQEAKARREVAEMEDTLTRLHLDNGDSDSHDDSGR